MQTKILAVIMILSSLTLGSAYADTIDFSKCATAQNHHCMTFSPQLNKLGGTNMHVTIFLPQTGAQQIDGILSADNYTNLQQNPAVMAVENIFSTTASPTLHYCPDAKYILENQGTPEYLNKFYDTSKTPIFNITHYVYPDYCFAESGPNPIDGSSIVKVPEFGPMMVAVLAVAVMSMIIITAKRNIK